jgi:hypothetical protein
VPEAGNLSSILLALRSASNGSSLVLVVLKAVQNGIARQRLVVVEIADRRLVSWLNVVSENSKRELD